jgi:flap endonuclease-1
MGIRGLTSLLKKNTSGCITETTLDTISGSKLAIDTSILLYKYSSFNKIENSHIIGFLNKTILYLSNGIIPIYVFDGKPPDEKNKVINERKEHKRKIYAKIEELEDDYNKNGGEWKLSKINDFRSQIIKITPDIISDIKTLMDVLGVPVIDSTTDAEKTCAQLQIEGLVDYTVTDDTDAFTFNAKKVIKIKQNKDKIYIWDLDIILKELDMSYDSFVDLCILSGCDYCNTIKRIGPITSFNIIKKYKNIENFIENNTNYTIPENYLHDFNRSRNIFKDKLDLPKIPDTHSFKEKEFIAFLKKKNFTDKVINKYISKMN